MTRREQVIVVGVDFGPSGDDAIVQALRLQEDHPETALHLVHVLDPRDVISYPGKPALETEEEVLEHAPVMMRERVEQIMRALGIGGAMDRVEAHVRIGRAVETLCQVAVDYDADLLVVGTHGRKGIDRWVLGSVAEALVRKAGCPVLVARPKDYGEARKTPLPDPPYPPGQEPRFGEPRDVEEHISTERGSWHPANTPPTGYRIV